jgi:hypothetical protein
MAVFVKSAIKAGLGLGLATFVCGGCAVHSSEMTVHAMPTTNGHAAAILAENAGRSNGPIQLIAADAAGEQLYLYAVAYAHARANGQPLPREFATVWITQE